MKKFTHFVFAMLLVTAFQPLFAQQTLHQVFVLNEGRFDYTLWQQDQPVTVGVYDPQTRLYHDFDVINEARFASDLIVAGENIYVAADTFLIRYDKNTLQREATQVVHGIRKLAYWNNQILVTRGDVVALNSYFQVYNADDLQFIYEFDPSNTVMNYATEGVAVIGNKGYVAVNNAFEWPPNPVGYLAEIDLQNQTITGTHDLGIDGLNPDNLMVSGNTLYTLNNLDFTNSSVSSINTGNGQVNTAYLNVGSGCGSSMHHAGSVYYQSLADPNNISNRNIGRYDVGAQSIMDTLFVNRTVYEMNTDPVNEMLYAAETDFTTYGIVLIYDFAGQLHDAFVTGVAPGTIAFDVREETVGIEDPSHSKLESFVHPNLASDFVNLVIDGNENTQVTISDLSGKTVFQRTSNSDKNWHQKIDVSDWTAGQYLVNIQSGELAEQLRFVKQ